MTKEQWLTVRNQPEIPMDVWFSFYKEKGGIADRALFDQMFVRGIWEQPIFVKLGKKITFEGCIRKIHDHYNAKFGV
jgi:hypothetical protein